MKYITGILAFGVPCDLDTAGRWDTSKKEWLDNTLFKNIESKETLLGDYGIEKNKLIPYREYTTFNVANHLRAYLDILLDRDFKTLSGLFDKYLNTSKSRKDLFFMVLHKFRDIDDYISIHEFMVKEFGSLWISYCESVNSIANNIEEHQAELQSIINKQKGVV